MNPFVLTTREDPSVPSYIKLEFGKSTSQSYSYAVQLASEFENASLMRDGSPTNTVELTKAQYVSKRRSFSDLWETVENWKSSRLYVNGDRLDRKQIYRFNDIAKCFIEREKAISPENHCFNYYGKEGWGCKHLISIERHLTEDDYYSYDADYRDHWFRFGRFISSTTWQIDKVALLAALTREAEQTQVSYCPHFSLDDLKGLVDSFPDVIDTQEDEGWVIKYVDDVDGASVKKVPHTILPKILDEDRDHDSDPLGGLSIGIDSSGLHVSVSRSDESENARYIPDVTFDDIGGIKEIIQVIREVVELPLKHPSIFTHLAVKPHKGVLLHGPPGCGKTMIAKAIANDIDGHFIGVKGPELLNKYIGQSEENLRNAFEQARNLQPSIIYFDEIDSIGQARSGEETVRHASQVVNQLLTLMDGIEDYGSVCVIASTNRPELLDSALVRPGRFDYSLEVKLPTSEGCREILHILTREMPISRRLDKDAFASKLFGCSGAEIAFVVREAAYNCIRRSLDFDLLLSTDQLETDVVSSLEIQQMDFESALRTHKERS